MIRKPMLAGTCKDFSTLRFPLYASLKLDGVRALKLCRPCRIESNYLQRCPEG
jgi:hypothetical protein